MSSDKHHRELIDGLAEQLKQIFDSSEQAVYLYLDDVHKACNKKFASLLNYSSPAEWASVKESFELFVSKKSQPVLISAYHYATEKMAASTVDVAWRKKEGRTVETSVTVVPISYHGHMLALHFISEKK